MAKREKLAVARLNAREAEAVKAFVKAVKAGFPGHIIRIALFGSKARGEDNAESDIDVMVVVRREDWRVSNSISTLAARLSLEWDVLLGPIVIGQERWERMGREKFSLYRNVLRDGLVLEESGIVSTLA